MKHLCVTHSHRAHNAKVLAGVTVAASIIIFQLMPTSSMFLLTPIDNEDETVEPQGQEQLNGVDTSNFCDNDDDASFSQLTYAKQGDGHMIDNRAFEIYTFLEGDTNAFPNDTNCNKNLQQKDKEEEPIPSYSSQLNKKKRILFVDDEPDVALALKTGLEASSNNNGFQVITFNDPLEALSNFDAGKYDLLLLDIVMPNMNGFELCEKMKAIDDNVKVCFITALEVKYIALREMYPTMGVDCFIKKPIETEYLAKLLNAELEYVK
jgi:CheY-like chemotaxis protein